jgi:hypothetical protein
MRTSLAASALAVVMQSCASWILARPVYTCCHQLQTKRCKQRQWLDVAVLHLCVYCASGSLCSAGDGHHNVAQLCSQLIAVAWVRGAPAHSNCGRLTIKECSAMKLCHTRACALRKLLITARCRRVREFASRRYIFHSRLCCAWNHRLGFLLRNV